MVNVEAFSKAFRDSERDKALYLLRSIPPYVGRQNPIESDIFGIQVKYRELHGEEIRREEMVDYMSRLIGSGFLAEKEKSGGLVYSLTAEGHEMVEVTAETIEI